MDKLVVRSANLACVSESTSSSEVTVELTVGCRLSLLIGFESGEKPRLHGLPSLLGLGEVNILSKPSDPANHKTNHHENLQTTPGMYG